MDVLTLPTHVIYVHIWYAIDNGFTFLSCFMAHGCSFTYTCITRAVQKASCLKNPSLIPSFDSVNSKLTHIVLHICESTLFKTFRFMPVNWRKPLRIGTVQMLIWMICHKILFIFSSNSWRWKRRVSIHGTSRSENLRQKRRLHRVVSTDYIHVHRVVSIDTISVRFCHYIEF